MIAPIAGMPGTADIAARISEIQSRIGSLTSGFQTAPAFELDLGRAGGAGSAGGAGNEVNLAGLNGLAPGVPAVSTAAGLTRTQPTGAWVQHLPPAGQAIAGAIDTAAREHGIDPALLASVVRHESNFDQSVISRSGAIGLAQLMPGTAEWMGVNPHDPMDNLRGGARYLREQLDRFGAVDLAVAAYNAGPNRVAQAGGIPQIQETQIYTERVVTTYQEWT